MEVAQAGVTPASAAVEPQESVLRRLLDSDPSIRWQAMGDLTGASAADVAAEHARVASEGAGARLLALQRDDGTWGGAAWTADGPPRCTR